MIDLSDFLDKKVFAICEDGSELKGTIRKGRLEKYPYTFVTLPKYGTIEYTEDGFYDCDKSYCGMNIKSIYLANQIPCDVITLRKKVVNGNEVLSNLKAEIESKLPSNFRREMAISYLETNYGEHLANSFDWSSSPQGHHYWEDLYRNEKELPDKGRIQILMWVVESYKQEFGI